MLDMVLLVDPVGMLVYLNPAADRLLGSLRLASSLDALFAAVHPGDVASLRAAIDEVLTGAISSRTVEHRCRAVPGGWKTFETEVQRVLNEGADTVLIVCRDVTAQRAEASQRSEAHAFEVAAQASGAVARDFGTLLLSLGRQLDLLTGSPLPEFPGEMRESRATLDSAWLLVDQLQSFGAADAQPHHVEINDTLEDLSTHLQRLAGPSIEVIQLLGASATRVAMSRADLEEVLSALVLRSREAIRASLVERPRDLGVGGRVVIVTKDGDEPVGRNGHPATADTVLEFTDTGIQMTAEERAQINSGATIEGNAHLERVQTLVRKAGGTLTVETGEDTGATIRLRWPVSNPS